MRRCIVVVLSVLVGSASSRAQDAASVNCGVNSAMSLARLLGFKVEARAELQIKYPATTVSLLDVKQMCQRLGVQTSGVRGTLEELLESGTPSIIGLSNPDHFSVLLDGTREDLRLIDGDTAEVHIVPRRDVQARFTGFALLPEVAHDKDAPMLQTLKFDQYVVFAGIGQKVEYHFPVKNIGKTPLSIQIAGTSCGCTAAVLAGKDAKNIVLTSGQSGEVIVSYQVQTQAPIQQTATLETNDPRRREVYLSIRGQLPPQLTLSPPALYVQQNQGEEPNKSFKVIGVTTVEVVRVWSDLPYLKIKIAPKVIEDTRSIWQVTVDGFAQAPVGPISGKIFVQFKDGNQIFLQVRGGIEASSTPGASEAALLPRAEDDSSSPMGSPLPTIEVGQVAPDFAVIYANEQAWRLSKLRGRKNVLLTFFPKCFTGGCANHLSSLRDVYPQLQAADVEVLAVSVDPAQGEKGQKAFAAQWKLPFPLFPDTERKLSMLYGAAQNKDELAARMTVLIDKQGIVRYIDTNVNVHTHGAEVLAKMHDLGIAK